MLDNDDNNDNNNNNNYNGYSIDVVHKKYHSALQKKGNNLLNIIYANPNIVHIANDNFNYNIIKK